MGERVNAFESQPSTPTVPLLRATAACAVLLLSSLLTGCEKASTNQEKSFSEVTTLVEDISLRYRRDYLFPEIGEKASKFLLENLDRGEYDKLGHTNLALRLTMDLQTVTNDVHSFVRYEPLRASIPGTTVFPKDVDTSGIDRIDHLPGNVGYLRITIFSWPKLFNKAVDKAMSSLAGTDALIIDVRDTPGGHSRSVAYLCSYFFEIGSRVHLNSFVYRSGRSIDEWTVPIATPYLGRPVFSTGGYAIFVPTGQAISPATKKNWEQVGVQADLLTSADQALEEATKYFNAMSNNDDTKRSAPGRKNTAGR